jgi:hypothetical protein
MLLGRATGSWALGWQQRGKSVPWFIGQLMSSLRGHRSSIAWLCRHALETEDCRLSHRLGARLLAWDAEDHSGPATRRGVGSSPTPQAPGRAIRAESRWPPTIGGSRSRQPPAPAPAYKRSAPTPLTATAPQRVAEWQPVGRTDGEHFLVQVEQRRQRCVQGRRRKPLRTARDLDGGGDLGSGAPSGEAGNKPTMVMPLGPRLARAHPMVRARLAAAFADRRCCYPIPIHGRPRR